MEFDQQLIDRTVHYFLAQFGLEITDETADEYLGQFAELYVSMAVFAGTGAPSAPEAGTRYSGDDSGGRAQPA